VLNDELELTDAVIVTELGVGSCKGAVYKAVTSPVGVIVPTALPPLRMPFTYQMIAAPLTPDSVTASCCVALARTVRLAGDIVMLSGLAPGDGSAFFELGTPAQLTVKPMKTKVRNGANRFRNQISKVLMASLPKMKTDAAFNHGGWVMAGYQLRRVPKTVLTG
jgi:hypothetical protein